MKFQYKNRPKSPNFSDEHSNSDQPIQSSFVVKEIKYLSWIFLVGIFWAIYFISPLSKPQSIEVVGNHQVSVEEIQHHAGIKKGQSIWGILADYKAVNERLTTANAKIKATSLLLRPWNRLILTIEENPAVGYFLRENTSYELLADATIIEASENSSQGEYPRLNDFSDELLKQLAFQLDKVSFDVLASISQIDYPDSNDNPKKIYLKMKNGLRIIGSLEDIGDKLNYYPGIVKQLPQKSGTLDMEVGIFYTPDIHAK